MKREWAEELVLQAEIPKLRILLGSINEGSGEMRLVPWMEEWETAWTGQKRLSHCEMLEISFKNSGDQ